MKRFLLIVTVVFGILLLISCLDEQDSSYKVGLIVSAAGANDKGYNEFAIQGLARAEEDFEIVGNVVNSAEDVPGSLEALAEEGFDLIFSLEYNFEALIHNDGSGESIVERYPETTFVIFNALANTDESGNKIHENVIEVLFDVNESSFLAGALAVMVNEKNKVLFPNGFNFTDVDDFRGVGFLGGSESAGIRVFGEAFVSGVNFMAERLGVKYMVYQTYGVGFASSPETASTLRSYYDAGVNVVFAAAGGVNVDMRNAAVTAGKLGVDVDANQDAVVPGAILTSVLKNTDVVVYGLVQELIEGSSMRGKALMYDLKSGATGITDLSTMRTFVDDDAISDWDEIVNEMARLEMAIEQGDLVVINPQEGDNLDWTSLQNVERAN